MLRRTVWALVLILAGGLIFASLALAKYQGTDVWGNVGPGSQIVGGANYLMDTFPIGRYDLDINVDAGLTNVGGVKGLILHTLAEFAWTIARWTAYIAITVFVWAFDLDLLEGTGIPGVEGQTTGVLTPLSDLITDIYQQVIGPTWMTIGILLGGCWAMWNGLVRRRTAETAGALALSVLYMSLALAIVLSPQTWIGGFNRISNDVAQQALGALGGNGPGAQGSAQVADDLFRLTIYDPFTILNFGGMSVCTDDNVPTPNGKTCRSTQTPQGAHGGYVDRFLALPAGSEERQREHEWLNDPSTFEKAQAGQNLEAAVNYAGAGSEAQLPPRIRAAFRSAYRPDKSDRPAVDIQQEQAGAQRLWMALLISGGNLGVALLIGGFAITLVFAQMMLLVLLGFAPIALVAACWPGRGHDFFVSWLRQVLKWLMWKVAVAVVLIVIVGAIMALVRGLDGAPWAVGYIFVGIFIWWLVFARHQIMRLFGIFTSGGGGGDASPAGGGGGGRGGGIAEGTAIAPLTLGAGAAWIGSRKLRQGASWVTGQTARGLQAGSTRAARQVERTGTAIHANHAVRKLGSGSGPDAPSGGGTTPPPDGPNGGSPRGGGGGDHTPGMPPAAGAGARAHSPKTGGGSSKEHANGEGQTPTPGGAAGRSATNGHRDMPEAGSASHTTPSGGGARAGDSRTAAQDASTPDSASAPRDAGASPHAGRGATASHDTSPAGNGSERVSAGAGGTAGESSAPVSAWSRNLQAARERHAERERKRGDAGRGRPSTPASTSPAGQMPPRQTNGSRRGPDGRPLP